MPETQMPESVHEVFDELYNDIVNLFYRYKLFKQLYNTQEAVDLLNAAAPVFFGEVKQVMIENILILISQLTDEPKQGKWENMTVKRLVEAIEGHKQGLSQKIGLTAIMKELEGNTKSIRDVRNRSLAHNDWGRRQEPIPAVMKEEIDNSIMAFEKLLQVTSLYFRDVDLRCEPFTYSDGEDLICVLGEWRDYSRRHDPFRWGDDPGASPQS